MFLSIKMIKKHEKPRALTQVQVQCTNRKVQKSNDFTDLHFKNYLSCHAFQQGLEPLALLQDTIIKFLKLINNTLS